MGTEDGFTADDAAKATTVLRAELGLPPQRFRTDVFVGMISDEIEGLRTAGRSDDEIANVLRNRCGIDIDAETIARFYVEPADRRQPGG
jgi:hypothetical protein